MILKSPELLRRLRFLFCREAIEAAFSGAAGGWPGRVPPGAAGTSLAAGLFFVRAFAAQHLPYAGREGCPDEGRDDEEP